jgi:crossover junction endodeoxyribonuclease RusA
MPRARVGLVLPWPDKKLSPNARQHWAQRSSAVKRARSQAYLLARGAMSHPGESWDKLLQAKEGDQINIRLTFEPPARYRYDIDNLVARMKSNLDGIADAIGIDDYQFRLERPAMGDPHKPHGRVMVTLELQAE